MFLTGLTVFEIGYNEIYKKTSTLAAFKKTEDSSGEGLRGPYFPKTWQHRESGIKLYVLAESTKTARHFCLLM
ncbi:MAG: hypothetical protein DRJ52_03005 [Thermoprotei archaeon]|nr:MAG: hypothetical protein DRJ52_03005 [Thermoprotei archaeon]RLF01032.1 MAG: hypothetical protein DRJ63_00410 [Thermoprotei archaeon]HDI74451.1 hypothetical protein [Thermoprotei archaeon]